MKLRCIKDTEEVGLFRKSTQKIEGITEGKVYQTMLFSKVDGTQVAETSSGFLIFNDLEKWAIYPVELFRPEKE